MQTTNKISLALAAFFRHSLDVLAPMRARHAPRCRGPPAHPLHAPPSPARCCPLYLSLITPAPAAQLQLLHATTVDCYWVRCLVAVSSLAQP